MGVYIYEIEFSQILRNSGKFAGIRFHHMVDWRRVGLVHMVSTLDSGSSGPFEP